MRTFLMAFFVMLVSLIWWFCGDPQPTQAADPLPVAATSSLKGSPLAALSCMQTLLSWHICITSGDCSANQDCVAFDDPCHNANGRELQQNYCVDQSQAQLGSCRIVPGAHESWHVACGAG